jgi:hypothetical protein
MVSQTLRMATIHTTIKELAHVPPLPSARLPRDTSPGYPWVVVHYPGIHHCKNGEVLSGSCTPGTVGHRLRPKNLDMTGSLELHTAGEPSTSYRIRPHHS